MKSFSRTSLVLFAILSVAFITIYFLRFVQVLRMREFLLQRKEINYKFRASSLSYIKGSQNFVDAPGIKIKLPLETLIEPGDQVEVIGSIDTTVRSFSGDPIVLTSRKIKRIPNTASFGIGSVYRLIKLLEGIPRVLQARLSGVLERDQASFMSGLVFGGNNQLSKGVIDDLKTTGLSHITSASGFNVSILIAFSLGLFSRFMNRRMAAITSLVTVFAYSMMAGFSPPITRAGLMGGLYLVGLILGRQYSALRGLLVAVIIMVINQPFIIFSISFLLSVASTLGLMFSGRIFKMPETPDGILTAIGSTLEETTKCTLSVLLFSAPIMITTFGTFSLVAPLSNSMLLWLVAPLTLIGLVFMPICYLIPGLGNLLALPLSLVLEVFLRSVHIFSRLPLASISIGSPQWWGNFGWYLCLLAYLTYRWHSSAITASKDAMINSAKEQPKGLKRSG